MGWAKRAWLWTLLVGVSLAAAGFGLERRVTADLGAELHEDLSALRDANVTAVLEWMRAQEMAAQTAAAQTQVRQAVLDTIAAAETPLDQQDPAKTAAEQLRVLLEPALRNWEFEGYVVATAGRIIAAYDERLVGQMISDRMDSNFMRRLRAGQASMTRPSQVRLGEELSNVMWVAAGIREGELYRGALAFAIDPSRGFSRILQTARFGRSGESYAFDLQGRLLSKSRFEEQLYQLGLLAQGTPSALHLQLLDPGVDLRTVSEPREYLLRARRVMPVTRANFGESGSNIEGYRDYRGIEVVGAWTWIENYEFGVVTELDREEAFASSALIRRATSAFLLVLLLLVCAMVIASLALSRLQLRAEKLGQYTLIRKIGEGGMGSVYEARHALLMRRTAVKVIRSDHLDDHLKARFEREVQATARLSHPNTVAVYDYGRSDENTFYYAMEYLSGATLREIVKRFGALPAERVVHILVQVLGSLAEAHEQGLVHRDIKPSNVMLCFRGGVPDLVKVLDFGLVKDVSLADRQTRLTAANGITGTPHYMAPEAISDAKNVDARSDIYAVGAMAFYLLTGREVFVGPNNMTVMTRHLTAAPERPSQVIDRPIPVELEDLILACLAKERDNRPQSAEVLIESLEQLMRREDLSWTRAQALGWWRQHPELFESEESSVDQPTSTLIVRREAAAVEPTITIAK